jgi:hypothetical protein
MLFIKFFTTESAEVTEKLFIGELNKDYAPDLPALSAINWLEFNRGLKTENLQKGLSPYAK